MLRLSFFRHYGECSAGGVAEMHSKKLRIIHKITRMFGRVKRRLPSTYPQPYLVIHMSGDELQRYYYDCEGGENDPFEEGDRNYPAYAPYAFCDGNCTTVHMHAEMTDSSKEIARVILHEIGHLYALQRYGEKDERWSKPSAAEPYADRFAYRWLQRLSDEGWF